ncbi:hypothetical protein [Alicyclobacillus dauci]|uniref:Uncharacterized protein n=1 Tax=Alicyclobacillus dauci TaxID=1475485 RepID=A0ABY6Z810_9BACL|nr:hypothetical protein [Alicyclobacillus dauci]WAH38384.1 hypothetical protein NZD86_07870 [Alicyclobacillus dauci]
MTDDARVLTNAEIDFWEERRSTGLTKHLVATIRDLQRQVADLQQERDIWTERLRHYEASAFDIQEIADRLQSQRDAYKAALERYNEAADRFIDKVDQGLAKSKETYNDLYDARRQASEALTKYDEENT